LPALSFNVNVTSRAFSAVTSVISIQCERQEKNKKFEKISQHFPVLCAFINGIYQTEEAAVKAARP